MVWDIKLKEYGYIYVEIVKNDQHINVRKIVVVQRSSLELG